MPSNLLSNVVLLFITTLILGLMLGYLLGYEHGSKEIDAIDSFEDCAAAGYPIMESYPERCATPDGRTFTKELEPPTLAQ